MSHRHRSSHDPVQKPTVPWQEHSLEFTIQSASRAADRASRAGRIAERHEKMIPVVSESHRSFHETQAAIHRQTEARHLAFMAICWRHACLLNDRLDRLSKLEEVQAPGFIDSVAAIVRSAGVCVGLRSNGGPDVIMVSDLTARTVHDLEAVLGEGPIHSCEAEGPLIAADTDIRDRWAVYAAAVEPLGVKEVASVPLRVHDLPIGSLTVFGTSASPIEPGLDDLCTIGDAVVDVVVAEASSSVRDPTGLIFSADYRDTLNQAAGIVAAQYSSTISDAFALLRAHAFATECDLQSVAFAVVEGRLRFDPR